jgi:hypothetical protein
MVEEISERRSIVVLMSARHLRRSHRTATPRNQLAAGDAPRAPKSLSDEQQALMERNSALLARELNVTEQR